MGPLECGNPINKILFIDITKYQYSFHYTTGVYLSLNDDIIPSHGYVMISDIGSTDDTALICHTNHPADSGSNERPNSGGNWLAPDDTRVDGTAVPGFRRTRDPMIIRLLRSTATDPPSEGIYHCLVEDDTNTFQTVYVGLYSSGEGISVHIYKLSMCATLHQTIIYW